jgi:hypothetical protein
MENHVVIIEFLSNCVEFQKQEIKEKCDKKNSTIKKDIRFLFFDK